MLRLDHPRPSSICFLILSLDGQESDGAAKIRSLCRLAAVVSRHQYLFQDYLKDNKDYRCIVPSAQLQRSKKK
jgi:hypothetical protein